MTMRAPGAGRQLLLSVERPLKYRYPGTGAFVLGGTEPKLPARYLVGPDIVEQPPRKEPGVQYARLPVRHSDLTDTDTDCVESNQVLESTSWRAHAAFQHSPGGQRRQHEP